MNASTSIWRIAPALLMLCGAAASVQAGERATPLHLYPVGGGYETALQGFVKDVMRHAHGPRVDLLMLPAAFADDPVLPEDPGILAADVEALQAACDAVLAGSARAKAAFPQGCSVGSVPLYTAVDARDPAIVASLSASALDGVFFNGGDQGYAMRILAGTPAESALSALARRGVVIGGTSAGAAIQSRFMNAGYTDAGDGTTALQKGAIDLWLGQTPLQRGLALGSTQVVIDEHVYSRGRLGRMLNASAQTADALGHGGLLGLGLDYDTGAVIDDDRWLGAVSGVSSAVVVDMRSGGARHRWLGDQAALSARRVLTHLLPPSQAIGFDLASRTPLLAGQRLAWQDNGLGLPRPVGNFHATLMLSGDAADDLGGVVLRGFARLASKVGGRNDASGIVIVASAYASAAEAQAAADSYAQALTSAGWAGAAPRILIQGQGVLDARQFANAAGVIFLGGDQSLLPAALADKALQAVVDKAVQSARVVLFERAMAAAVGDHFDAVPGGDSQDDAIAAFRADNAVLKPGLGLLHGAAFEPRLQVDSRWGRLYGSAAHRKQGAVYGISESSAIVLSDGQAKVLGPNPVVVLDARRALFTKGDNGALAAFNVLLDVYESGETLGRDW
ncbi:MAG: hypothetical protein QM749_02530 [Aquabacterium sp.]